VVKILKRVIIICVLLIVVLYVLFSSFTSPKSDENILDSFKISGIKPKITQETFKGFHFRKIIVHKDDNLPTIVFVHGAIGSLNDFNAYMIDSVLQSKVNMIAYDRIGYGYNDENFTQEDLGFERDMLNFIIKDIDNLILVGYSYGGPIALSIKKKIRKIVLLAPAIYSEYEIYPWVLNFYKWKLTRWLLPKVWQEASKEKLSHKKNLKVFEAEWHNTSNSIMVIHGDNDWIVPYENSKKLVQMNSEVELITIKDASHSFVWSHKNEIKKELLKELD